MESTLVSGSLRLIVDNPQQFIALLPQILSLTQKPFPKVEGGLRVVHIRFLMYRFTTF